MAVLSVDAVTKRYDTVTAVDNVSLGAKPGRILGLLGPNGAGKTSTIRMITYITVPDEGTVSLDGTAVGPWSQSLIGYLPEERGLYTKMKVGEQLEYLAALRGVPPAQAHQQARTWLERLGAEDWWDKKADELSKGMQQKVQFIATVLHEPALLILDEPFTGLDPINAELLKEIILELKDAGRTILFASHRMEQVEQLCDDVCLISQGQVLLSGGLREVKQRFGKNTVTIDFVGDSSFAQSLADQELVRILSHSHQQVQLRLLEGTSERHVLETALQHVETITRFELDEPPLQEVFVQVVGEQAQSPTSTASQ
ncbi:MAG: ATP-binding cassette domain-containing protein [Gemmatimonadetes bacterium]|nr:ATP-binding cassette domain-containing protein [Gemmatimonadota bacterium]MBT4608612.1 ATP-binding cassette domain-containing protein [Gemmatimonadota bacterium]MBT5059506.1 ATP-binding cassette domain-containing protein [Gemmatimonadota bacterium]MBT5146769.1 ATP-binding cassette domain-containing protein [Gemmatimonadota bacterium]MBT5590058.1 ATP-binding cassette domain-containing protein [Gemmatimonadota bacterium]